MSSGTSPERLQELAEKWLNGTIMPEEAREYAAWYNSGQDREVEIPKDFAANDRELRDRILSGIPGVPGVQTPVVPVRRRLIRVMAAAAVLLLLVGAGYLLFIPKKQPPSVAAAPVATDVSAPAANRAMVLLPGGQKILLDSAGNGLLAQQSGVRLQKLGDGRIAYDGSGEAPQSTVLPDTLINPRGSRVIDVTLADGSRVWLNAGSRLIYPAAFSGIERAVELDGEAYFEVAHRAGTGFVVHTGNRSVQVLGTHFNVNAYSDEQAMTVTLLEGSVKVEKTILKPDQQAVVPAGEGAVKLVPDADVEAAMAWKNGYFDFKSMDIDAVLRQIGRWYDVDVEYEGAKPQGHFTAMLNRDMNASTVLKGLAYSGIRFRIEGHKIIIMQ